jgi:hypothetical protein
VDALRPPPQGGRADEPSLASPRRSSRAPPTCASSSCHRPQPRLRPPRPFARRVHADGVE